MRRPEQTFFQGRHTDDQQAHEKMLNIDNFQRNANQNNSEKSHLSEWLSSKRLQITNVGEDVKKKELLYAVGGK